MDLVVPGNISVLDFAMPATAANVYVEFEENVYTSVDEICENDARIYSSNGALAVETNSPLALTVIALDGRVVYNATITGNTLINLPRGIYIANNRKVVVR